MPHESSRQFASETAPQAGKMLLRLIVVATRDHDLGDQVDGDASTRKRHCWRARERRRLGSIDGRESTRGIAPHAFRLRSASARSGAMAIQPRRGFGARVAIRLICVP